MAAENEKLEAKVKDFEIKLSDLSAAKSELEQVTSAETAKLKKEIERLTTQVKEKEQLMQRMSEEQTDDSQKTIMEANIKINLLSDELGQSKQLREELVVKCNMLERNIEEIQTKLSNTQNQLMNAEAQNVEEVRNDLNKALSELQEQIEKFEKLDLQTRKLKQENRLLEKFMTIEMRSPQDIMEEFRSGMVSDRQFLSGYQTDANNEPASPTIRSVSRFNLNFESNIY